MCGDREVCGVDDGESQCDGHLHPATTTPTLTVGTPRVLFEGEYVNSPGSRASWDATPDGQRFLLLKKVE